MADDGRENQTIDAEDVTDELRVRHGPDRHPIEPPPHAHPDPAGSAQIPRLAEGLELVGEYEGSGFKEAPFIVRRADGQMVQLPEPLYRLLEMIDGRTPLAQIAEQLTERMQRTLSPDDVGYLVDEKLVPLGLIAPRDGQQVRLERSDPLLALKFRTAIVPRGAVRAVTAVFKPLFFPPVVVAALVGVAILDIWLFGTHGVAQPIRDTLMNPEMLLLILGLFVVSAMFHEVGHATGCAYGGAKPGAVGVGLYIVWPAFYTDVTDAYRLGRGGRLRTDLGGIYFNALFALGVAGIHLATGSEALLVVVILIHFEILHQLLPFLRLDGYYILADLTGVPDMFSRIRPVLLSLLPWKGTDERVKELRPWARAVVTLWVLTVVPLLAFMFGQLILHLPRIMATAAASIGDRWTETSASFGSGNVLRGIYGLVQILILALPLVGLPLMFARIGKKIGIAAWRRTDGKPVLRASFGLGAVAALAFAALAIQPGPRYTPIQPHERGTFTDAIAAMERVAAPAPAPPPASEPAPAVSPSTATPPRADPTPATVPPQGSTTSPSPTPTPTPSPTPTGSPSPSPTVTP